MSIWVEVDLDLKRTVAVEVEENDHGAIRNTEEMEAEALEVAEEEAVLDNCIVQKKNVVAIHMDEPLVDMSYPLIEND